MRQRDPLSPERARELDALERALAGEPVDPDLRELESSSTTSARRRRR